MKNTLKLNHENHTIVMDRTFAKYAENTRSEEYAHLQRVRQDYPMYEVIRRKIKRNTEMEHYKGLNYEYMEDYIMTHGSAETVRVNLKEFYEKRLIAECHGKAFRYPAIKRWFLEKYPEITEHGMEKTAQIIEIYDEPEENKTEEQDASA